MNPRNPNRHCRGLITYRMELDDDYNLRRVWQDFCAVHQPLVDADNMRMECTDV